MITLQTTSKPAKVKRVRQLIPVNAVVWVPGDPLPDQVQRLIDNKIEEWAVQYDKTHTERLRTYRPPAPIELGKIVEGLFYQLSGVYFEHGIEAVGLFLQELKAKAATRLKNEAGTLDMAKTAFERSQQTFQTLESILAGTLQIAVPEKRYGFQQYAQNMGDKNLKKTP